MKNVTIDASGKPCGRFSSEVARILMGKGQINFSPATVAPVKIHILNINSINIAPKKLAKTEYFSHSGYIGNLKKKTLKEKISNGLEGYFLGQVGSMLPNNRLRKARLKNIIFDGKNDE